jgi:dUTPase
MNSRIIKTLVLPDGRMPTAAREGEDVGYDGFVAAIVEKEIDPETGMRRRLWNFNGKPHPSIKSCVRDSSYILYPGCSIRIGFGIIFGMTSEWFTYLTARSSAAEKRIDVQADNVINWHRHVPIDPGFRGEPCAVLTNNSTSEVVITNGWSPAQFVFLCECCDGRGFIRPTLMAVSNLAELPESGRGVNWNGSSGNNGQSGQLNLL